MKSCETAQSRNRDLCSGQDQVRVAANTNKSSFSPFAGRRVFIILNIWCGRVGPENIYIYIMWNYSIYCCLICQTSCATSIFIHCGENEWWSCVYLKAPENTRKIRRMIDARLVLWRPILGFAFTSSWCLKHQISWRKYEQKPPTRNPLRLIYVRLTERKSFACGSLKTDAPHSGRLCVWVFFLVQEHTWHKEHEHHQQIKRGTCILRRARWIWVVTHV